MTFYFILLTCTVSRESAEEAQNIDEEPVAAKKTTDEALPSIDPILPITGKYLINHI